MNQEEDPDVYTIDLTVVKRVLRKTAIPENEEVECWEWQGSRTQDGYGHVSVEGKLFLAHRVMYVLHHGEIPPGMVLLHQCDNRRCVSPFHLRVGTQAENLEDMHRKGRWKRRKGDVAAESDGRGTRRGSLRGARSRRGGGGGSDHPDQGIQHDPPESDPGD